MTRTILFLFVVLILILGSKGLHSQPQNESQNQAEKQQGPTPSAKSAGPPPELPPMSASLYGFVKGEGLYANHAALTFGRENLLAPTQAKRRVQFDDSVARHQFTAHQSRFGILGKAGDKLEGRIEVDFVGDYSQSSPNTSVTARIRHAYARYAATESTTIWGGQYWDVFAPGLPGTFNATGVLYGAGNVGWIREQLGVDQRLTDHWVLTGAVGAITNNLTPNPRLNYELNGSPSFAAKLTYKPNAAFEVAVSGIGANIKYQQDLIDPVARAGDPYFPDYVADTAVLNAFPNVTTTQASVPLSFNLDGNTVRRRFAGGGAITVTLGITDTVKLTCETYYGRNLADLRTLALAGVQIQSRLANLRNSPVGYIRSPTNGIDLTSAADPIGRLLSQTNEIESAYETGGMFTVTFEPTARWQYRLYGGVSKITNPRELVGGPSATQLSRARPDAASWGASELAPVKENQSAGASFAYRPYKPVSLFVEIQAFRTLYYDAPSVSVFRHLGSINVDSGTITAASVIIPDWALPSPVARVTTGRIGLMLAF